MKTNQFLAAALGVIVAAILFATQGASANFLPLIPAAASSWADSFSFVEKLSWPSVEGEEAWNTWEKYLQYAHVHNISEIAKLAHSTHPACADPARIVECVSRLDYIFSVGSTFKKEDFTNVWSDQKQIIISTDYKQVDDKASNRRGWFRSIIYFSRDENGEPKLIGFKPTEGAVINKDGLSEDAMKEALDRMTLDTDKDSLTDVVESCSETGTLPSGCTRTDPYDPDTNGDGWWDGIEILLR